MTDVLLKALQRQPYRKKFLQQLVEKFTRKIGAVLCVECRVLSLKRKAEKMLRSESEVNSPLCRPQTPLFSVCSCAFVCYTLVCVVQNIENLKRKATKDCVLNLCQCFIQLEATAMTLERSTCWLNLRFGDCVSARSIEREPFPSATSEAIARLLANFESPPSFTLPSRSFHTENQL